GGSAPFGAPTATPGLGLGAAPPLHLVLLEAGEDDRDVAGPFLDPDAASPGARAPALEGRALVGVRSSDEQLVFGDLVVVLGVRDRGVEQLVHLAGRGPLAEPEGVSGGLDVLAPDEREDLAHL